MDALEKYKDIIKGKRKASFIKLGNEELEEKRKKSLEILKKCEFCEWKCNVNRDGGELGKCKVGKEMRISSMFEHYGEEPPIIPSGTIFFSGCNFQCIYCQNWDISQFPERGYRLTAEEVAGWVNENFKKGKIKNVNFVGGEPTPNLHNILDIVSNIKVNIPIIWNSNMYMSEKSMKLLDGVIDMYLADFRYGNNECAKELSGIMRYVETVKRNHLLAIEQAELIIRVLVIPGHVDCCAKRILEWIGENIGKKAYVNLMRQYRPCWKAMKDPRIGRPLTKEEFSKAKEYYEEFGLKGETQE